MSSNLPPDWRGDDDIDYHEGYVTDERAEEFFIGGLQAMREMLARFVEQDGHPALANSMRLNWNPSWGKDPGRPEEIVKECWDL